MVKKPKNVPKNKNNVLKKPSVIFQEAPELEYDPKTIKLLAGQIESMINGYEVQDLSYSQEWYGCSKEVYDILNMIKKRALDNIEILGEAHREEVEELEDVIVKAIHSFIEQDDYIADLKNTNLIFTVMMTVVGVIVGMIIGLIIYII